MAASYLQRFLQPSGCKITLLESAKIGSIGVGEATIPPLVQFVRNMGFEEEDFMRRCAATYKLGIRFTDWVNKGESYWHPFGLCGGVIDGYDLFYFWLLARRAGHLNAPYSSYSLQALIATEARAPRPIEGPSTIMETGAYAYHLDAGAFADYLRLGASSEGVSHKFDEVVHVKTDSTGLIQYVDTEGGRRIQADLYIDCTGFKGLLIEETLNDPWIDWSHMLLCDRAIALPLPRNSQMGPYTQSTGMNAGWMWQIPLSHRVGCGYVYSSSHLSDEDASRELLATLDLRRPRSADPRLLKMRVGRRTAFWKGNCVSVGLASGFVEPLESTGIYLIQKSLELLARYFPSQEIPDTLVRTYNKHMESAFEEVRDFILLHYLFTQRNDSAFWQDSRCVPIPGSVQDLVDLYEDSGMIDPHGAQVFAQPSYFHILSGAKRLPRRILPPLTGIGLDKVEDVLQAIQTQNRNWAQTLPSHEALMEQLHRSII